jgi:DNA-binding NarL/FixJ family response regulator
MNLGYCDIHEAATCNTLMNELVKKQYTHLILDIILSDGNSLEVIPNIRRLYPELAIMIFSMQAAEIYGEAVKQYDISYYLSKGSGEEEMLQMLQRFLKSESPSKENRRPQSTQTPFSALTPRELEILHYLLKGAGTKMIGETLNLKKNTVSTMKGRIFEKTNAANLKELIELATLYNLNF